MAVLESNAPLVLPFTDTRQQTLMQKPDPINAGDTDSDNALRIENRKSIKTPAEVHDLLLPYFKSVISKNAD